jgi:hypothetical protein
LTRLPRISSPARLLLKSSTALTSCNCLFRNPCHSLTRQWGKASNRKCHKEASMPDRYTSGIGGSSKSQSITKSDLAANNFPYITRAIYVGGAGAVNVVYPDGSTQIYAAVPAGTILPVEAIRVNETSTDATNMVAMF